jgi:hypothetical protein
VQEEEGVVERGEVIHTIAQVPMAAMLLSPAKGAWVL